MNETNALLEEIRASVEMCQRLRSYGIAAVAALEAAEREAQPELRQFQLTALLQLLCDMVVIAAHGEERAQAALMPTEKAAPDALNPTDEPDVARLH